MLMIPLVPCVSGLLSCSVSSAFCAFALRIMNVASVPVPMIFLAVLLVFFQVFLMVSVRLIVLFLWVSFLFKTFGSRSCR